MELRIHRFTFIRLLALPALFCALGFTAPAGKPAAAPAPASASLDLNGYLAELDRWSVAAADLRDHPDNAAALEKTLPPAWTVTAQGQRFRVPTSWLRETLVSLESNHWLAGDYSKEIRGHLALMRADGLALTRSPSPDAAGAQKALDAILARREFGEVSGPTGWDLLRERIGDWLIRKWSRLFSGASAHPRVMRGLFWGLSIALAVLFLAWLGRLFLRRRPEPRLDFRGLPGPLASPAGWRSWSWQAAAAADQGNFREAIRLAYWSGIYRLEELGAWQVARARTPREYLRLLSPADGKRQAWASVTSRFERTWYGRERASADDFQLVASELEGLGCTLRLNPATGNS